MLPMVGKSLPSYMPWPGQAFFLESDFLATRSSSLVRSSCPDGRSMVVTTPLCSHSDGPRMAFGDSEAASVHHRVNSYGQHLGWLPASDTWSPDDGTGDVTRCYARCAGHRIKIVATDHDEDKQLDELHVPRTFKRLIAAMAAEPAILTNPSREREF